jgi:hypothetical protein
MEQVAEHKIIRKRLPSVRVYLDGKSENMGLSKYNEVVVPGTFWEESLTCLERNGQKRWLTGLNEFAPEVQMIADSEKKAAVIKNIREKVAFLERAIGANVIDVEDKDFWAKVKTVRPDNHKYWGDITLRVSNEPVFLDPETPEGLIVISAIEAGGFSCVGKSYDDARLAATAPKWYLDREVDTSVTKNELRKIKNKAKAELTKLFDKDSKKLFYIVKNVDNKGYRYTLSTSNEVIYGFLDDYLEGKGAENEKRACMKFQDYASQPLADLKIRAVISDASFYKFIIPKADGKIYHSKTNLMLGGNVEEILEFFKNPINANTWELVLGEVEERWKV